MPGLRIHHPTHRNCIMQIPHPGEFKRNKKLYNKGRRPKDYQITLDNDGNAIVSETVWMRLQEADTSFIVLNEIKDPPSQLVGFVEGRVKVPAIYKEIQGAIKEIAPPEVRVYIGGDNG